MNFLLKGTKRVFLPLLVVYAILLTGCSSFTDFVVVNESNYPIEIRYKVKKSTAGPLVTSGLPATIDASRLSTRGGLPWEQLNASQYQLAEEPEVDTVVVRLMSNEALRLTNLRYEEQTNCKGTQSFPITEILILGPNGKLQFLGDRARTGFSKLSRALCVVTYK